MELRTASDRHFKVRVTHCKQSLFVAARMAQLMDRPLNLSQRLPDLLRAPLFKRHQRLGGFLKLLVQPPNVGLNFFRRQ